MSTGQGTPDEHGEHAEETEPPPSLTLRVSFATPQAERAAADLADELDQQPPGGVTGWIEQMLGRACDLLGRSRVDLSVVIIGDEQMTALHDQFMQIAETTDVLTFDLRDDEAAPIEGEVYICLDEARRRAAEYGHPVSHELLLYALHGLLHLAGHDDKAEDDWRRMHAAEDDLLLELGVGRVFDVNGGGGSR